MAPIKDLFAEPMAGIDPMILFWQAVIASILATLLSGLISYTYKETHRGGNYSQSFSHVLVIMTVVVALIMIVIGSNIARAFSLVGALSIIRYRTAVKDARDTAFVFFAMMVGISCGVGLRAVAIFATFFVCFLIYLLGKSGFGSMSKNYSLLKFLVPTGRKFEEDIAPFLEEELESCELLSTETVRQGTAMEMTYKVEVGKEFSPSVFIEEIQKKNGNEKVFFFPGNAGNDEN